MIPPAKNGKTPFRNAFAGLMVSARQPTETKTNGMAQQHRQAQFF
tara:strand:+ start:592 stop:726 length:135 start_codon:yes stop_codon:yes gene_type:complete